MLANAPYAGRSETLGAVTASSRGTVITASGTANTKGSWTNLGTTTFEAQFIQVVLQGSGAASADYTVDIGISDGSNRFVICEDLRINNRDGAATLDQKTYVYNLPIRVPQGAVVDARCQASTASAVCRASIQTFSEGLMGAQGGSRCIALYTPGTSRGAAVDPGASANTKGAWAQMVASTAVGVHGLLMCVGGQADVAVAAKSEYLIDIGLNAASSEFVIVANLHIGKGTSADVPSPSVYGPMPIAIPNGTRIAARAQSSITTAGDRLLDIALWGIVP